MKILNLSKAKTGLKKKVNFFNFYKILKKKIVRIYFFDEKKGFESSKRKLNSDLIVLCLQGRAIVEYNSKKISISKKKPFLLFKKNNSFKIKGYINSIIVFLSDKNY